jgi:hypothetical protein
MELAGAGASVDVRDTASRPVLLDGEGGGPSWEEDERAVTWTKAMPAGERYLSFPRFSGQPSAWSAWRSVLKEERYATAVSAALPARVPA